MASYNPTITGASSSSVYLKMEALLKGFGVTTPASDDAAGAVTMLLLFERSGWKLQGLTFVIADMAINGVQMGEVIVDRLEVKV